MNEKILIKKLSILKEIEPSEKQIGNMKSFVLQKIDDRPQTKLSIWQTKPFIYAVSLLVFLIMVGFSVYPYAQDTISSDISSVRIQLADNHYKKAKIAFEESQRRLNEVNASDVSSAQEVMNITATTNAYISHLHLEGEKGKYTEEQCKVLYKEYASYLSTLNQKMKATKQYAYQAQVAKYQEQAKMRMSFYKT